MAASVARAWATAARTATFFGLGRTALGKPLDPGLSGGVQLRGPPRDDRVILRMDGDERSGAGGGPIQLEVVGGAFDEAPRDHENLEPGVPVADEARDLVAGRKA